MAKLLVDTDVFIDHLRGFRSLSSLRGEITYSVLTRAELFAGTDGQMEIVRTLLAPFMEIALDRDIAELSGELRRGSRIDMADAVIAASAIITGAALVTRNLKDFAAVPHLKIREPN